MKNPRMFVDYRLVYIAYPNGKIEKFELSGATKWKNTRFLTKLSDLEWCVRIGAMDYLGEIK